MRFPFNGIYPITRVFGVYDPAYSNYPGSRHSGTDYGLPANTPLVAACNGQVAIIKRTGTVGRGNEVVISTSNYQVKTCHMNRVDVTSGQTIRAGEPIGLSGYTGYVVDANGNIGTAEGAHLHAEVLIDGQYANPEKNFKEEEQTMLTAGEFDEIISLAYNNIGGRPPTDADFNFHRKEHEEYGDIWALRMLKGFEDNNDVMWKKQAQLLAQVSQAAGVNPDHPLGQSDVDKMAALIDAKNKQIDSLGSGTAQTKLDQIRKIVA